MTTILQPSTASPRTTENEWFDSLMALPRAQRIDIITRLLTHEAVEAPLGSGRPPIEQVLDFLSWARSGSRQESEVVLRNEIDRTKDAESMLKMKEGFTGPERVLISAVKLASMGKTTVSARQINHTNDSHQGAYVSNVSTAIMSSVKEGFMTEIENEGQSDYQVTERGFAYFDYLSRRSSSSAKVISINKHSAA